MMMSKFLAGAALSLAVAACVSAEKAIDPAQLGLSKTDVFDAPSPEPFAYPETFPGANETAPPAYPGLPSVIPHSISNFVPVTAGNNRCLGCHDKPQLIGKKAKGMATPMPASHYTDLRKAPDTVTKKLIGARYVCTQCHVPQADVEPLVESTF